MRGGDVENAITLATPTFARGPALRMLHHRTCSDQRHHGVGFTGTVRGRTKTCGGFRSVGFGPGISIRVD